MTPELQRRWQTGIAPFDGTVVVAICDEPILTIVLEMLYLAFERLRHERNNIWIFSDWHEHDGFVMKPKQISWNEFAARLSNPKSLYESRDSDEEVRIALFPDSFEWLLRYNIEDAEENYLNAWCELDYSCTPNSHDFGLVTELNSKWPGYTNLSNAKRYFDNSYGG
ncbi:MAG: hypothetical protein SH868_08780 [Bythopirellula sp.]|nr:hypothetical protein [Bythopirellula sp.]